MQGVEIAETIVAFLNM